METITTDAQNFGNQVDPESGARNTIRKMLEYIGEDPDREGLVDTPKRIVKSWKTLFGGYDQDPAEILSTVFSASNYDQMVILRDIEMFSTCEHHGLVFFGKVSIAYIPNQKVVGLSKLARLVECFSRRMQIQEQMTNQIADALQEHLMPKGCAVLVEAKHMCMVARGVQKQNSVMTTSALRGIFKEDIKAREEFLSMVKS